MRAYQLFREKNIKALLELYHDDVEWIGTENENIPFAGHYHGKSGVAQYFAKMNEAMEPVSFVPQKFIAEGDVVVVTGTSNWRVRATGHTYYNPWVHVMTLRDGKVQHFQQYNDTAAAEAAFRPVAGADQAANAPLHH